MKSSSQATEEKKFDPDVTRISVGALNSTPTQKLGDWLGQIFQDMDQTFSKSMILLKNGDHIIPWKWDENFVGSEEDSNGYSLVQPSPFRIVLRTQKPYHGYVVENEVNKSFFKEWNDSQTPEHLTIAPIVVDDHVIGMLLGLGEKESETKENLDKAQRLANGIAKEIKSRPDRLKAA